MSANKPTLHKNNGFVLHDNKNNQEVLVVKDINGNYRSIPLCNMQASSESLASLGTNKAALTFLIEAVKKLEGRGYSSILMQYDEIRRNGV